MKSVPFILLFWAAAGIGISTFVEDAHGTPFIQTYVYGTWWFKLLWTAVVVTSAALFVRRKTWKNFPLLVLHLSFGVIFAGALTTALPDIKEYCTCVKASLRENMSTNGNKWHACPS